VSCTLNGARGHIGMTGCIYPRTNPTGGCIHQAGHDRDSLRQACQPGSLFSHLPHNVNTGVDIREFRYIDTKGSKNFIRPAGFSGIAKLGQSGLRNVQGILTGHLHDQIAVGVQEFIGTFVDLRLLLFKP